MTDSKQNIYRSGTRQVIAYTIMFVLVFSVLYLPAVLAATLFARFNRGKLRRFDYLILAAVGVAAAAIDPIRMFWTQLLWFAARVGVGSTPLWPVPWAEALGLAAMIIGLGGLLFTSTLWGRVAPRAATFANVFSNPLKSTSLIPSEQRRTRAKEIAPIGGVVAADSALNMLDGTPGARQFAIGVDEALRPVYLSEGEIGMHGLILGSTGSGKTETVKALAARLLDLGWPGTVVDMKEDTSPGGLRDFFREYADHHAVQFQQLCISDPDSETWLNPLMGMGPDEARDTVLALTEFDDNYWQSLNKKLLGALVSLLYDAHSIDPTLYPYPTMHAVARILSEPSLPAATKEMRDRVAVELGVEVALDRYSALGRPTQDEQKSASGFGAKLMQLYNTVAGRTVLRQSPTGSPTQRVELDVTRSGVTYVGLDLQGKKDLATIISAAVLQRMSVYAARRVTGLESKSVPRFLIVDEASHVPRDITKNILARARSAGIVVFLCTQSPQDWIDDRGDDWAVLSQNMNVGIIMSQGSSEAAELCAEYIGKTEKLSVSQRVTDLEWGRESMLRQNVDYLVQPHELRALRIGEAVLRVNKPVERVQWVSVKQRDPKAVAGSGPSLPAPPLPSAGARHARVTSLPGS